MNAAISAAAELADSPQSVFEFLADLRNHASLAPGSVELLSPEPNGSAPARATVRLRGPLAIRRTATTAIVDARRPTMIAGHARIGRRTCVSVSWTIASRSHGSRVSLRVFVEETGFFDGLVLALGGRRWLQRRFAEALECLAGRLTSAAAAELRAGATLRPCAA